MAWNDEKIELLKKLWAEGLSCSVIADRMGDGLSRNAVIGKVSRLRLPGRDVKVRQSIGGKKGAKVMRKRHQEAKRIASGKPPSAVAALFKAEPFVSRDIPQVPESQRKVLDDLGERDCRFPYGDGPFTFCARPKVTGLAYCEDHARICFQPPKPATRPSGTPANQLRLVADNDSENLDTRIADEKIATSGAVKAKETV